MSTITRTSAVDGVPARLRTWRAALVVARFELKLLAAERSLWAVIAILGVAIVLAAISGRHWQGAQNDSANWARLADLRTREQLRSTLEARARDTTPLSPFGDARNPYTVGTTFARRWIVLPAHPLGPIATGQSDLFPSYARVSMLSRETLLAAEELENPANLLAGRFDLAFVIAVLYPLLVIALAYNVLSGEREGGTLRLLRAQPIALRAVLLGKAAARAGVLTLAAIVLVFTGAMGSGISLAAPGALGGLVSLLALVLGYGLFWFALALAVNSGSRPSATNALWLVGAWLLAVVLVPSLLAAAVSAWAPAPSRVELVQARRQALRDATARAAQSLAAFMQDHPELTPRGQRVDPNDAQLRNLAVQDDIARTLRPLTDRFERQLERQQAAVDRWRYASPALAVHGALVRVAGTDAARFRSFERDADAYVTQLRDHFATKIIARRPYRAEDLHALPSYQPRHTSTYASTTRRVLLDVLVLLGLAGLITIVAARRVARAGVD